MFMVLESYTYCYMYLYMYMCTYIHDTGIWSLHCGADDSNLDNTLVVSFVGQTT